MGMAARSRLALGQSTGKGRGWTENLTQQNAWCGAEPAIAAVAAAPSSVIAALRKPPLSYIAGNVFHSCLWLFQGGAGDVVSGYRR